MKKLFINEYFILFIIVINVAVIFISGFSHEQETQRILEVADHFLTFLFLVELVIKLDHIGFKKYFSSRWNILDFILIIIAIPSLIYFFFPKSIISLDYLLAFRILRVFKFFRFFRFIPKIDHITDGVFRAIKSSSIIIITFFILNLLVGILSSYLFKASSQEYFGDPLISLYSVFKIFTVEGWYEIPDTIASTSDSSIFIFLTRIYFIGILLIGGIFGLSLVNSIFVDSMLSGSNDELQEKISLLEKKIDFLIEKESSTKNNE